MSEQLDGLDVWSVEDMVHRHPEWLKYPFRDGMAADFIYRFAQSSQAQGLLNEFRERVREELLRREVEWRERVSKEELLRTLPKGEKERFEVIQRIRRVVEVGVNDGVGDEAVEGEGVVGDGSACTMDSVVFRTVVLFVGNRCVVCL